MKNLRIQAIEMVLPLLLLQFSVILFFIEFGWIRYIGLMIGTLYASLTSFLIPIYMIQRGKLYCKELTYNPFNNVVEIHIGRAITEIKLARLLLKSIRFSRERNAVILFYTNHLSEERLRSGLQKMEMDVQINKPNIVQWATFYLAFSLITIGKKKGKIYPLLRCEIYPK